MLTDLQNIAAAYGLDIHPDKNHILSNISKRRGRETKTHVNVNDNPVQILGYMENTKHLGRKLLFDDYHTTELDNRIAAAWRKFNLLQQELTSKTYPSKTRLRLFDATIRPTMLYGSASWTLTKQLESTLQRTQRRMLRIVIGTPRRRTQTDRSIPPNTHTIMIMIATRLSVVMMTMM